MGPYSTDQNEFNSLLLSDEQKRWAEEVYWDLPKKIRRLIERYHLTLDYSPRHYPDKDEIAYFIKPNLIEFNRDYNAHLLKKDFFIGALTHEAGHFYIFTMNRLKKKIYLILFKGDKELLADHFARKFGFSKENEIIKKIQSSPIK